MTTSGAIANDDLIEEFTARLTRARARLLRTLARTDEGLATLERHEPGAGVEDAAYGVCERCARPIPLARLRAVPTARCCRPCQAREEQ